MSWLLTIGLANALLASVLAVVPLAFGRWLRRPALAHLLWIVVLCKLLAPPLVQIPLGDWFGQPTGWLADASASLSSAPARQVSEFRPANSETAKQTDADAFPPLESRADAVRHDAPLPAVGSPDRAAPQSVAAAARRPSLFSVLALLRFCAAVWIAGSVTMLVRMARRAWQFHSFVRLAAQSDERLAQRVAQLAQRAGLSASPKVAVVEHVVSPMLWGLGRGATLLFPAPLARRLDDASCDALLLHELAHYARGDGWVRLLELAVQTLYWWHPLVWLARREIEAVEEECCDAWALKHQSGGRRLYAEALLATVDFLYEPPLAPLPPAACGLGEAPLLRRRLTQIMCGDLAGRSSRTLKAFALSAAAAVLPFSPAFVGSATNKAEARSVRDALAGAAPAALPPGAVRNAPARQAGPSKAADDASFADVDRPAQPTSPRVPSLLWATATSGNGKYRLEARTGRKTTLVHVASAWRLDLSAHRIVCASFSPDSGTLATGHEDSLVRLWDCETGALLKSLKGSTAAIASVAFAPEGRRLAAGAEDGSVLVWDPVAGDEITRLPVQQAPVNCVRWSPRGDRLAVALGHWSAGDTAALVVWTPGERLIGPPQPLAQPVGALDWLPDGKSLVLADWDGRARVWNVSAETTVGWLTLEKDSVSAAAWSPDCPLVARRQADQLAAGAGP